MLNILQNSALVKESELDINEIDVHQLEQAVSKKLLNVHREGRNRLRATCPNCKAGDERGRSFYTSAKVNYQFWHCHTCDHKAPTSSILGLVFAVEARPVVADFVDGSVPTATLDGIRWAYRSLADFAHEQLLNTPHALQYLHDRGATDEAVSLYQLGFVNKQLYQQWCESLPYSRRFDLPGAGLPDVAEKTRFSGHAAMFAGGHKGKIVFPYADELGNIQDIRTRSISSADTINGKPVRYTSPKGGQEKRGVEIPYGAVSLGDAARVLITEGEFKSIIPAAHGVGAVLALRGTSDRLESYLPILRGKHTILAFDNDDKHNKIGLTAGESATITHARLLIANGISVTIVRPSDYGDFKGIDDLVHGAGPDALEALIAPGQTITLSEYEADLSQRGADLSGMKQPRGDAGVKRLWTPDENVDRHLQPDQKTVTVDDAVDEIRTSVADHIRTYNNGNDQMMVTASAGVGKTFTAINEVKSYAEETGGTVAVILPSHGTIDEKKAEGVLEGFRHVYGRRSDDEIHNCEKADSAQTLTKKGFSPGAILCPTCPFADWCNREGYKAQFKEQENRAYVHAHAHSDYPENENVVIVDELSHRTFAGDTRIYAGDILNALDNAKIPDGPRSMLEALLRVSRLPYLDTLSSFEFYEVLESEYPQLRNVELWGDGEAVQTSLNLLALDRIDSIYELEQLPDQFGERLLSMLASDVRQLKAGNAPTGRIRLVRPGGGDPFIELVYSKGRFPGWYGKRPTVVLNATADVDLMNDLIGPLKVVAPVVDVLDGNDIIQDITRNNAKFWLQGAANEANRQRWFKQMRLNITDESDTVIITTKSLESYVKAEFPLAKVAYYLGIEGRNDLQAGTTILANSPPVNMGAAQREAASLYPGIDTSLTRSISAFDYVDASGRALSVEQVDAVDPRLQVIIDQHRDAVVVQAFHRARMVRETGRKVVALFSRPIPGIRPTQVITERPGGPNKATQRKADMLQRLADSAQALVSEDGGFTLTTLSGCADVSRPTANKYWLDTIGVLPDVNGMDIFCIQPMANGGSKQVTVRLAVRSDIADSMIESRKRGDFEELRRVASECIGKLIPSSWSIDFERMGWNPSYPSEIDRIHDGNVRNNIDSITDVSVVYPALSPILIPSPFDTRFRGALPESLPVEWGGGD